MYVTVLPSVVYSPCFHLKPPPLLMHWNQSSAGLLKGRAPSFPSPSCMINWVISKNIQICCNTSHLKGKKTHDPNLPATTASFYLIYLFCSLSQQNSKNCLQKPFSFPLSPFSLESVPSRLCPYASTETFLVRITSDLLAKFKRQFSVLILPKQQHLIWLVTSSLKLFTRSLIFNKAGEAKKHFLLMVKYLSALKHKCYLRGFLGR